MNIQFNALMPELYVTDFKISLHFYTVILGFKLEYQRTGPLFAFLSFGNAQLMIQELVEGEKEAMALEHPFGRGMNFEIEATDVNTIIDSLKQHNYALTRDIKESWRDIGLGDIRCGSKEILVNDPNGYLLRFSQNLGRKSINTA